MSKDLNNEFNQYINELTPDLWNRIEPALEPKTKVTKFNKKTIYKYSGLIAACICLAVMIPVFINQSRSNDKDAVEAPKMMTAQRESADSEPNDNRSYKAEASGTEDYSAEDYSTDESIYDDGYANLNTEDAQTETYVTPCDPEISEMDGTDSYTDNGVSTAKEQDTEQQDVKITDIIKDSNTGIVYYVATNDTEVIYLYTNEVVFVVGKEYTVFTENTSETRDSYPVYRVLSSEEKAK